MMKLLIALALAAAPSALAFTQYMPSTDEPTAMPSTSPTKDPTAAPTAEKNGCGELCANVITIELQDRSKEDEPFYVESGTCYVVDGTLFNGMIPDVTDILCEARKVYILMNLLSREGRGDLLRRVARRFRRGGRADVLVEHGAELVEGHCAVVVDVGHVEHLGQRFFRRGLVVSW